MPSGGLFVLSEGDASASPLPWERGAPPAKLVGGEGLLSNRNESALTLARMDHTAFIAQGLRAAGYALSDIAARANLHLKPETLTKSLKRRCMGQFRMLATLIRRLIFLLALSIEALPPGPEPATARARRCPAGPRPPGFRMVPVVSGVFPESFRCASGVPAPGPVDAGLVLARWAALHRVLSNPLAPAVRLAQTLARWQATGEPKPMVGPSADTHRLPADLGLVASLLPDFLRKALERWPDTS